MTARAAEIAKQRAETEAAGDFAAELPSGDLRTACPYCKDLVYLACPRPQCIGQAATARYRRWERQEEEIR